MWKTALVVVTMFAASGYAKDNPPKEGSYYTYGQLGIRKTQVNNNRVDLVFKPVDEQFYWCPGVKVQKTKKATVVTFVRCKTSKSCGVDSKASIEKRLVRKVSIDTNGLDVYVRNGPKKFKLLYKSPNSKLKAKKTGKKGSRSTSGSKTRTRPNARPPLPATLQPAKSFQPKRQVLNYRLNSSN